MLEESIITNSPNDGIQTKYRQKGHNGTDIDVNISGARLKNEFIWLVIKMEMIILLIIISNYILTRIAMRRRAVKAVT